MSAFANLKKTDQMEEAQDSVGQSYEALASNIYNATIILAYIGSSQRSKAQCMHIHYTVEGNDQEFRDRVWFTNGQGENFYVDKKSGKENPLPGFTMINDMCLFATEEELSEQDTETKVVKLYDPDEKAEVNTEVEALTALHGADMKFGILKVIEDRNSQNDAGEYVPTGKTITKNEINKVFHLDEGRTINEFKHGIEEPEFAEAWLKKNEDKEIDRSKGTAGGARGGSGSGSPFAKGKGGAGQGAPKKKSGMFGKK